FADTQSARLGSPVVISYERVSWSAGCDCESEKTLSLIRVTVINPVCAAVIKLIVEMILWD
ncbi:hypothetical protein N8933_11395, partial [Pseudomonadales bacterium]|nr:hypothetical protein [Pseudomonadales bacterium]